MNKALSVLLIFWPFIFLCGCNSEIANLSPLIDKKPFFFQLGAISGSRFGNSDLEELCQGILVDNHQNTYCAGSTQSSLSGHSDGSQNAFILKLDFLGRLLWIKQFNASNNQNERIVSLVMAPDGDILAGGQTAGLLSPENVVRIDTGLARLPTDTDRDGLIIKISRDGHVRYIKQFGTSADEGCGNLVVSKPGNIFCAGGTTGRLGNDSSGNTETRANNVSTNSDAYVIKFDKNHNILWKRQIGSTDYPTASDSTDRCSAIAIDQNENIFCGGSTEGNLADIHGGQGDVLVWSLNGNGTTRFLTQLGTNSESHQDVNDSSSEDFVSSINVASDGSIYIVGDTFNLGTQVFGNKDVMIAKFYSTGNLEWLKQFGTASLERGLASTLDKDDNLVLTGTTRDSFLEDFGGVVDIFIGKVSPDSSIISFKQFGSVSQGPGKDTSQEEYCYTLTVDHENNLYCGGATKSNFAEPAAGSSYDVLIFRLNPDLT